MYAAPLKAKWKKMLVLGCIIYIVQRKNAKKPTCRTIAFFLGGLILANTCTLKIVHSKSPVHGHDPKYLFPHRYKTVLSVCNKNTSK